MNEVRRTSKAERRELRSFLFFISPWLFGFFIVTILPLLWGFYLSLTNYTGWGFENVKFTGLANYLRFLTDLEAWAGLGRTAIITFVGVPAGLIGGFSLAVLLNQKVLGQRYFRTLYYIPSVVPGVALVVIWQTIYNRNAGLLNAIIDIFHQGTLINWISDYSNLSLIVMLMWGLGSGMVIYLASLQGVPTGLKEAAAIDGANAWQSFHRVTLPLVTPVIFFQLVMGIIHSLQMLVPALLLTSTLAGASYKAPIPNANRLYMVHLYQQTFEYQRFGYGLALAWILFVIVFVFSLLIVRSGHYWVYYEVEVEAKGGK